MVHWWAEFKLDHRDPSLHHLTELLQLNYRREQRDSPVLRLLLFLLRPLVSPQHSDSSQAGRLLQRLMLWLPLTQGGEPPNLEFLHGGLTPHSNWKQHNHQISGGPLISCNTELRNTADVWTDNELSSKENVLNSLSKRFDFIDPVSLDTILHLRAIPN